MKKQKGITLIALVVTIVVLLILAGVALNLVLGENGIITRGQEAKLTHEEEAEREQIELALAGYYAEGNGEVTMSQFPSNTVTTAEGKTYAVEEGNIAENYQITKNEAGEFVVIIRKSSELTWQVGPTAYATLKDDGSLSITGTGAVLTGDYDLASYSVDIRIIKIKELAEQEDFVYLQEFCDAEISGSSDKDIAASYCYMELNEAGSFESYIYPNMQSKGYTEAADELKTWIDKVKALVPDINSVTIEEGITEIGEMAFYNAKFTQITIPDSVEILGYGCFEYGALEEITFGENSQLKTIDDNCFLKSQLKSIAIPKGVTTIQSQIFKYCYNLTDVTIPDSVTTIENYAFNGCTSLKTITIPVSVTTIGASAFYGCSALKTVTIQNSSSNVNVASNAFPSTATVTYTKNT